MNLRSKEQFVMEDLSFTQDLTQQFVNGVMRGFTKYVRRRNKDANDFIVSRAGAWMK